MTTHRRGAGYTIPAAAEVLCISYKTLLKAVDSGEVLTVDFGGLRRIPKREVERIRGEILDGQGFVDDTAAPALVESPQTPSDIDETLAIADIRASKALASLNLTLRNYVSLKTGGRPGRCEGCGGLLVIGGFDGHRTGARFCGSGCRAVASRARKA